jgi:hypothetical protein
MFLHELSRRISQKWRARVDSEEYVAIVRKRFENQCPYCLCSLSEVESIVEHLDGMNRYRAGLHVPGNVLVACKRCNSQKRRDDSLRDLVLAESGWASFLSHDGTRCDTSCRTCRYWTSVWEDDQERDVRLRANLARIRSFRNDFPEFERSLPRFRETLPQLLTKLYSDCQNFAESEIRSLLIDFEQMVENGS